MGIEYSASFKLEKACADLSKLQTLLQRASIHFNGIGSHYAADEDGYMREVAGLPDGLQQYAGLPASKMWTVFENAIAGGAFSVNASMIQDRFQFTFGVVPKDLHQYAILTISDNNIYRMSETLPDYQLDVRSFLVCLYQALNANCMAFGVDADFGDLYDFMNETLPLKSVEETIRMAVAVPQASEELFTACGGYELIINHVRVLSRNFFGAPNAR